MVKLSTLVGRGVLVRLVADEAGSVRVSLGGPLPKVRRRRRSAAAEAAAATPVVLAAGRLTVPAAGTYKVRLKPSRKARLSLLRRRGRSFTLKVHAGMTDRAGNATSVIKSLKVRG